MEIALDEFQIDTIIRQVMEKMGNGRGPRGGDHGIFPGMEEALDAVQLAQGRFNRLSLAQRKAFIQAMRETAIENSQHLAEMAVAETRIGRVSDKIMKNRLVAEKTPGVEDLQSVAFQGDDGLTVEEVAPFGTILAILPVTNPSSTVINNAISMISAGNTVVFAPHPTAKGTTFEAIRLLNQAIEKTGGPPNLLVAIENATLETVQELMTCPRINLICATGGKEVVRLAMTSGKRAIGAAAGNPPVIVDETANPEKAAREIIAGHSFDNNLPCVAEKEVVVVEWMAEALLRCFGSANALVLDPGHLPRLEQAVLHDGHLNKDYVGKDASVIAKQLGISADDDLRAIVVEVDKDHPLARYEQMMPVLPVIRAASFDDAVEIAVELEGGLHHTAAIHSANINHMSEFNKAINTTIFVKNAPTFAGLGFGGEGYTSFTIAGASGEGMTTARTFCRRKRCSLVGAFSLV
jgi:propionaldehyde dehydrogenase